MLSAALSTSACVPSSEPDPEPTPTATPLFASDEEALAAAEEAYGKFLSVSDEVFAEGGAQPERLQEVATGRQLEMDLDGYREVAEQKLRSVGTTTFGDAELQSRSEADGEVEVIVYLCEDVSGVDVLDSNGASIVLDSRPNETRYEVLFESDPESPSRLLVESREVWADGKC